MKTIKPKVAGVTYEPKVKELNVIIDLKFTYSLELKKFLINENPHGEASLKEIFDMVVDDKYTTISFKAIYRNKESIFKFESQNEIDRLIFELLYNFNLKQINESEMDKFEIFFENGKFKELDLYKQNKKYELINSLSIFNDGEGIILIKQNPWGRFKLKNITCSDSKELNYKFDDNSLGMYSVDVNDTVYDVFSKLIDKI